MEEINKNTKILEAPQGKYLTQEAAEEWDLPIFVKKVSLAKGCDETDWRVAEAEEKEMYEKQTENNI